jgi:hypothetical protein
MSPPPTKTDRFSEKYDVAFVADSNDPLHATASLYVGKDSNDIWHLACKCPEYLMVRPNRLPWCGHIKHAIKTNTDSVLHSEDGSKLHQVHSRLMVPIFVKPALQVMCVREDADHANLSAINLLTPSMDSSNPEVDHFVTEHLGIGHLTYGRFEMRRMVIEWLQTQVLANGSGFALSNCNAAQHFKYLSDDKPYDDDGLPSMALMVDFYDLHTTRWCRICNLAAATEDD